MFIEIILFYYTVKLSLNRLRVTVIDMRPIIKR